MFAHTQHLQKTILSIADEIAILREGELVLHESIDDATEMWTVLTFDIPHSDIGIQSILQSCKVIHNRDGLTQLLCLSEKHGLIEAKLLAAGFQKIDSRKPTLHEVFIALA